MSVAPATLLTLTGLSCKIKVKDNIDFPHYLKDITVKAHHPQHGCLGELFARRIDRGPCRTRGDFHQVMDMSESYDLPMLATTLFDKWGRLKPELTENGYLKGTGAFGHELDDGVLLYVFNVTVQPEVRCAQSLWTLLIMLFSSEDVV